MSYEANQPTQNLEKRYSFVIDGEIYNLSEIKSYLHYNLKTSSDVEIILAAVSEKGLNWFLDKASGIYAICIYDSIENEIYSFILQ